MKHLITATAVLALFTLGCDDGEPSTSAGNPFEPVGGATTPPDGENADDFPDTLEIVVDAPGDGDFVTARPEVFGRVVGFGDRVPQVKVNDVDAEMEGAEFTASLRLEAGVQTIVVRAAGASVRLQVTVDDAPPVIDITHPQRATHTTDAQLPLTFRVTEDLALNTIIANGLDHSSSNAPDFNQQVVLNHGLNIVHVTATDEAGNTSKEAVSVLSGDLRDPDAPIESALRAHIGERAFDTFGRVAADFMADLDLVALAPPFEMGVFDVTVLEVDYRVPASFDFVPRDDGLEVAVVLRDLRVAVDLALTENTVYRVTVAAGRVEVNALLNPRAIGGALDLSVASLEVELFDFGFGFGDDPELEEDPDVGQGLLEDVMGEVMETLMDQQLPGLVGQALGFLEQPLDIGLIGAMLRLHLRPNVVLVTRRGLSARIDVTVELLNPAVGEPSVAGYLGRDPFWDGVPSSENLAFAVEDDLINCVLYQVWRSGVLFPTVDGPLLRSTGDSNLQVLNNFLGRLVGLARPEVDRMAPRLIETELPLPIVAAVAKGRDGVAMRMGIGDLAVTVRSDDAEQRAQLHGAMSMIMEGQIAIDVQRGDLKLDFEVGDIESAFDIIDDDLRGKLEVKLESNAAEMLEVMAPVVTSLVNEFELPTIPFVRFDRVDLDAGGPDGEFLVVDVTVSEP